MVLRLTTLVNTYVPFFGTRLDLHLKCPE